MPTHRVPKSPVLALTATAMALVAMFGDRGSFTVLTTTAAIVGLIPWALAAGGVQVPLWAFAVVVLGASAVIVVGDSNGGGLFPAIMIIVVVTRATGNRAAVAATVSATLAMVVIRAVVEGSAYENGTVFFFSGALISLLAGRLLRKQEALTAQVRAMHELTREHAAIAERTHIAREVHDIVAHSLTVVMLHLTGARRALPVDPQRADEALARAESVGRSSLDSIRQMVVLLRGRSGTPAAAAGPPPGVADLAELIEHSRSGGLMVDTDIALDGHELDAAQQLVVYRVVQESLSNVLQHSPGARCRVTVRPPMVIVINEPAPTALPTANAATRPRSGLGLIGMAERARATGGTFRAGPTTAGGWRVAVELPDANQATTHEDAWAATT